LEKHNIIIFQHPLFWYSTPSILKEWQDIVLEHQFAYGRGGDHLKDKHFFHVISMGAGIEQYKNGTLSDTDFNDLFTPTRLMARLTKMHWHPPFVVDGVIQHDISSNRLDYVCEEYRRVLIAMRDGFFDFAMLDKASHINTIVNKAIKNPEEIA
ncbi:MAG: NAD(P)H-dependent oxidoreductase, partial [Parachlamydiaceae bacterium]